MRFAAGVAVSATLLTVGAAGCGGSHGSSLYTLAATKTCMEKQGFPSDELENNTLPGSRGNLRVQVSTVVPALAPNAPRGTVVPNQYVFLVFGASPAEAQKLEDTAITKTVHTLFDQGISATRDYVRRGVGLSKNVFFYSPSGALTPSQRAKVDRCLR
jgi:hypothetical protein